MPFLFHSHLSTHKAEYNQERKRAMDGVNAEQEHRFQSAHQLYLASRRYFRDLDIPPRKLLTRRLASLSSEPSMDLYHLNDSPRFLSEEAQFLKFLPRNSGLDDESDPYACDQFRMYDFKIRKCTRSKSHDWTECPFAHPGEKARRRCPRRYNYSGNVCPDFRQGSCGRGDTCEFAHGVFESWLHPSRYRTEACKDGLNCQRKVCFFAHTPSQLRTPPPTENVISPNKHVNPGHCAVYRYLSGIHHNTSPTSILDMDKSSPPSSPPFSPAQPVAGFSPVSRFSDRFARTEPSASSNNKVMPPQAIKELMNSMNAMKLKNAVDQAPNKNHVWIDSFAANDDPHSLFAFSPSIPSPLASSSRVFPRECNPGILNFNQSSRATGGPDLDWVNDLLT